MPSRHHIGGGWITATSRLAIYLRDGFSCMWCLCPLHTAHPRNVTLDHITPREHGGSNAPNNIVTACKTCNSERGTLGVSAYARLIASAPSATCSAAEIVRRIRNTTRRAPNRALARDILSGQVPDPRPIVVKARQAGKILAPKGSGADKTRTRRPSSRVTQTPF